MGVRLAPSGPFTAAAIARRIRNQTGGQQVVSANTTAQISGLSPFTFSIPSGTTKAPKVTVLLLGAWQGAVASSVGILTATLSSSAGGSQSNSAGAAVVTPNLVRTIATSLDSDDVLGPDELLGGAELTVNAEFFADADGDLTIQDFQLIVDVLDSADDSPFA